MSDVAVRAGVATSTVSRALKQPEKVDPETRQRILRIIEEIGYVPNATARNLRGGTSRMVLIVLPEMLSPVVLDLLRAIDATLSASGYTLIIGNLGRRAIADSNIMDLAQGGLAAGILLVAGEPPHSDGRSVLDSGLPTVALMVDLSAAGIPSVVTNDLEAMRELTAHLIKAGHRRFFYVAGPQNSFHEVERSRGVLEALAEAGLGEDALIRHAGDFTLASGYVAGRDFLGLAERPGAALCCNDEMAIGFASAIQDGGLIIPDDVAVSGFDGIGFAHFRTPALTTVRQPLTEIGEAASRALIDLIERGASPSLQTVLASEIVLAASTEAAPDSEVRHLG